MAEFSLLVRALNSSNRRRRQGAIAAPDKVWNYLTRQSGGWGQMARRNVYLAVIAFSLAIAGCVGNRSADALADRASEPTPEVLRLKRDYGNRAIVEGYINEQGPFDFIVDTAATSSVLFKNLKSRIDTQASLGLTNVIALSGVKTADLHEIKKLQFGALDGPNRLLLLPDWEDQARTPQGIIGLDFLADYFVRFDIGANEMQLFFSDRRPSNINDWRRTPLHTIKVDNAIRPLIAVEGKINSKKVSFLIDTGSDVSICNLPVAEYLRVVPALVRNPQTVGDANGGSLKVYDLNIYEITIGDSRLLESHFYLSDAPFFPLIGYAEKPICVFGLDNLSRWPFAIDFHAAEFLFPDLESPLAPSDGKASALGTNWEVSI